MDGTGRVRESGVAGGPAGGPGMAAAGAAPSRRERSEPGGAELHRGRFETPEERSDRNWVELLQELRVTQTSAQLLTGFLLTLPFQPAFGDLDRVQVGIYLTLVVLAAVTTVLVVAPVSAHRLLFQRRRKPELVRVGNRVALAGVGCLGLVVTGTVLLIFDVVLSREVAVVAAGAVLALVALGWLVVPLVARRRRAAAPDAEPERRRDPQTAGPAHRQARPEQGEDDRATW